MARKEEHDERSNLSWIQDPRQLDKVAKRAEREANGRDTEDRAFLRLYWDRPTGSGIAYDRVMREQLLYDQLKDQTINLTAEVIDAAMAHLTKPVAAEVLPVGADHKLELGCKVATRLIDGVAEACDWHHTSTQAIRDGLCASIGPVKGYVSKDGEISMMRLKPTDVKWIEDGTGRPRTVMHITAVPRDYLLDQYGKTPDMRHKIRDLRRWAPERIPGVDPPGSRSDADTVRCVEAWARALSEDTPGAHAIVSGDLVFTPKEEWQWNHQDLPIFRFIWKADYSGWGGCSLARRIAPYDVGCKKLMDKIDRALEGSVPRLVKHRDSNVDAVSNLEFEQIEWDGAVEPRIVVAQVVSPDIVAQIDRKIARAYAEGGVPQGLAQGAAPPRFSSGKAQIDFVDIANQRMSEGHQQVLRFHRDFGRTVVMLAEHAKKMRVKVKGLARYENMSFPKMSRDKYSIDFGLVSGLSQTPSARLQQLRDLKDDGVIDTAEYARSMDLPDTKAISDRTNAPRDQVLAMVDRALDDGIPTVPSPMWDLDAFSTIARQCYQLAELRGTAPRANREMLRRMIMFCDRLRAAKQPAPVPAAAPVAAPQQAVA